MIAEFVIARAKKTKWYTRIKESIEILKKENKKLQKEIDRLKESRDLWRDRSNSQRRQIRYLTQREDNEQTKNNI